MTERRNQKASFAPSSTLCRDVGMNTCCCPTAEAQEDSSAASPPTHTPPGHPSRIRCTQLCPSRYYAETLVRQMQRSYMFRMVCIAVRDVAGVGLLPHNLNSANAGTHLDILHNITHPPAVRSQRQQTMGTAAVRTRRKVTLLT